MTKMNFTMTDDDVADLPVDEQVVLMTRRVMASDKDLSYAEAQEMAMSANPKLAQAYLGSNGARDRDGAVIRPDHEIKED